MTETTVNQCNTMSQTLKILPSITSPVTVAQAATFASNLAAIENLDNRQVKALSVVSLIYLLNNKGGTDYRTNHKQLRTDATNLFGVFPIMGNNNQQESRYRAVLDWNAGFTADSTVGSDVNALVSSMGGERDTPEPTLLMLAFFLRYKLAL